MIPRRVASLCAIAWMACASAFAADGIYISHDHHPNGLPPGLAINANGDLFFGGNTVTAVDSSGTLLASFADPFPRRGTDASISALAVRPDNVLIAAVGAFDGPRDEGRIYKIGASGAIQAFVPGGEVREATAIAVYPDSTLMLGGHFTSLPDNWYFHRLSEALSPYPNWTERVKDIGGESREIIRTLKILPDGKILAGGAAWFFGTFPSAVIRLMPNGDADFGFGTTGMVKSSSGNGAFELDASGNIYVNSDGKFIVRLTRDGAVDNTFVSPAQPANVRIERVQFDSVGRLVLFGTIADVSGAQRGYVARLMSSGALDTSFGSNGEAFLTGDFGLAAQTSVNGLVAADDKPVIALVLNREADPGLSVRAAVSIARLNVDGTPDVSFGANQPDADIYPDAVTIPTKQVPYGTIDVTSDPVTVNGINGPMGVSVLTASLGTQISSNCQNAWTTFLTLTAGSTFCVRHSASTQPGAVVESRLNADGRLLTFTTVSTSEAADTKPDSFSFVDRTDVPLRTVIFSNTVTITGITGAAPVVVDNGFYSINCNPSDRRGSGTLTNGQSICLGHDSATSYGQSVNTTVSIGGVVDIFTSTTPAADTQPNPFAFSEKTGATAGSEVISDPITIVGFNSPTTITVSGGTYSRSCDPNWTAAPDNTATDPLQICVKLTASSQPGSRASMTLTVGGVSADFTVTTASASGGGDGNSGGGGGGGGAFDWPSLGALALLLRFWKYRVGRMSVDQ